jgi:hypothetical protein
VATYDVKAAVRHVVHDYAYLVVAASDKQRSLAHPFNHYAERTFVVSKDPERHESAHRFKKSQRADLTLLRLSRSLHAKRRASKHAVAAEVLERVRYVVGRLLDLQRA